MNKPFSIIKRYWLSLLRFNLLLTIGATVFMLTSPKVWTAHAKLILPENTSKVAVSLGTLGSVTSGDSAIASESANQVAVQKEILLSDALMETLWKSDPEKAEFPTVAAYRKLFTIQSSKESSTILAVSAQGSSSEQAMQRANALLKGYQERLNQLRQINRKAREDFSRPELEQAEGKLKQAQDQLAQLKADSGLVNNEEQVKGLVNAMSNLTTNLAQANAQAQSGEHRVQVLSERLQLSPEQAIRSLGLGENRDYQLTRQNLVELEANLIAARARFTDDHPKVSELLDQRAQLLEKIQGYVAQASGGTSIDTATTPDQAGQGRTPLMQQLLLAEAETNAQKRTAAVLQANLDQLSSTLKTYPRTQEKLTDLQRQVEIAEGIYKGLVTQVKQTSVDSFNSYPNVQILDPPTVEHKPSSPKLSVLAIGVLLAALLGSAGLILFLEALNPLLRPKDLKQMKFPWVIRVPQLRSTNGCIGLYDGTELEFQRLASAVSLQPIEQRRLLIASAQNGEGKTTVALKLAISLTDLGFRVLLMDADYRQATLSRKLGVGDTTKSEPVPLKPELDLLPTSPQVGNLMELVTRGHFQHTLMNAEDTENYDYILVDSSALDVTGESILMASLVQQALFVVHSGKSERKPVMDSLDQLKQHGVKLVGLVVNDLESKSRAYTELSPQSNIEVIG